MVIRIFYIRQPVELNRLVEPTGVTEPGTVNAGLLLWAGESITEGLGYGCLKSLMLQQVMVDRM